MAKKRKAQDDDALSDPVEEEVSDQDDEEEEEWEVSAIKKHKIASALYYIHRGARKTVSYLVAWKGFPDPNDDTWVKSGDLYAINLIDDYWRGQPTHIQPERYGQPRLSIAPSSSARALPPSVPTPAFPAPVVASSPKAPPTTSQPRKQLAEPIQSSAIASTSTAIGVFDDTPEPAPSKQSAEGARPVRSRGRPSDPPEVKEAKRLKKLEKTAAARLAKKAAAKASSSEPQPKKSRKGKEEELESPKRASATAAGAASSGVREGSAEDRVDMQDEGEAMDVDQVGEASPALLESNTPRAPSIFEALESSAINPASALSPDPSSKSNVVASTSTPAPTANDDTDDTSWIVGRRRPSFASAPPSADPRMSSSSISTIHPSTSVAPVVPSRPNNVVETTVLPDATSIPPASDSTLPTPSTSTAIPTPLAEAPLPAEVFAAPPTPPVGSSRRKSPARSPAKTSADSVTAAPPPPSPSSATPSTSEVSKAPKEKSKVRGKGKNRVLSRPPSVAHEEPVSSTSSSEAPNTTPSTSLPLQVTATTQLSDSTPAVPPADEAAVASAEEAREVTKDVAMEVEAEPVVPRAEPAESSGPATVPNGSGALGEKAGGEREPEDLGAVKSTDVNGHPHHANELRHANLASWDSMVHVVAVEPWQDKGLVAMLIWEDDSYSWVTVAQARDKCPRSLVDFFLKYVDIQPL